MGEPGEDDPSWGDSDVVADYDTDGVTDPGERAALISVRDWVYGRDVLDLGIGGGRTTGMLLPRAGTYVGVDVAPEMLALARERFPDADLREGDAAVLAGISAAAYDLVVFSFNGLDAVDHTRRGSALRAMRRAVRPTGRVLFSSLNLDGVSFDEHPLRVPGGPRDPRFRHHVLHYGRHPGALVRSVRNHRRVRAEGEDGPGWATRPLRAHEFRFLVHFATLGETVAEARAAGLEVVGAYADDGTRLDHTAERCTADYVHFVCAPGREAETAPRARREG